jgi:hypothetical protein
MVFIHDIGWESFVIGNNYCISIEKMLLYGTVRLVRPCRGKKVWYGMDIWVVLLLDGTDGYLSNILISLNKYTA